jgi:hypothetical protein
MDQITCKRKEKTGLWMLQSSAKTIILAMLLSGISFVSCKKDRAPAKPALGYTSPAAFYSNYKQQEQIFQVDSPGTGPIIGKMGTKLYPYANIFMFPGGQAVAYPFTVKLVELYPVKDVILWNLQTIAGGKIMQYKAEISARAFKGSQELVLRPGRKFGMETAATTNMLTGMSVFYGFGSGRSADWTNNVSSLDATINPDTLSSVTNLSASYAMNIARMGWTSCAKLPAATNFTGVTFTCTGNTPQNIDVFLVFNNGTTVMQCNNLTSGPLPIGTQATMVAIAYDQNNALVYDKQNITVSSGMQVQLNMVSTTDTGLLSILSAL